jgi:arsenite-transporting ATPase
MLRPHCEERPSGRLELLLKGRVKLVERAPRHLFFTGKGGVGKTSVACATALALAERGRRVLVVSTDPASNLDEVLETSLGPTPSPVRTVTSLFAMNLDPEALAHAYRERLVGPYRGVLPDAAVRSIEEQLSGACTTEIAAFDEFSKLLGDEATTADFDHVVFDTAPTGHTLRLLELPAAWTDFLESNAAGTSCLGPLAGLKAQQASYAATRRALTDPSRTVLVLVSRPERSPLAEADRTLRELRGLGVERLEFVLNGIFEAQDGSDPVARSLQARGRAARDDLPSGLASLPRTELPLMPFALVGIASLRRYVEGTLPASGSATADVGAPPLPPLTTLVADLARHGRGLVMTMGKGGVGKTTIAVAIAAALAETGHAVHLTTTDPATDTAGLRASHPGVRSTRIDPVMETRRYVEETLQTAGAALDDAGRSLLEEDLRSPCTEEVAVFRAFARVVQEAARGFVVIDTAPTGHTLLLLDAAEAYHREVLRTAGAAPEDVRQLLPRLRDPEFTRILLVTLAEATPVHEAAALQADLGRAGIRPFAWVINQSLSPLTVTDPLLRQRRAVEARYLHEVCALSRRAVILPWISDVTEGVAQLDGAAVQMVEDST